MSLPIAELQNEYTTRVIPALKEKRGYKNVHQVPRLMKVVINTSIASAPDVKAALEIAKDELQLITGQKPVETIAKKAISNFKLRAGQPIGAKVTLRGRLMYEFLERLIKMSLPRIRDFRGVSGRAFDGRGNYNVGVKEQIIFPEIEYDKIDVLRGMNISITTTAKTDEEAKALLTAFSFPFRN